MHSEATLQLIQDLLNYKKYNQIEFFKPYEYQSKFMNASSHYKQRYMRAANRTGKTYGAAAEFAMHITGRYQDWYEGERILDSGHDFWCVGVDLKSVARVMQKELLGTDDIRVEPLIGTGMIPKEHIALDIPFKKDGGNVISISIRHTNGGLNTLYFWGSNQHDSMMGSSVKFVWMDEEPPFRSEELYSQCKTRTATVDGHMMLTATPEFGQTPLNNLFDDDKTGKLYLQSVTWAECPHLTPERQAELLAGIPEWQHDMRSKGIPVLGSGAVFPITDEDITEPPVKPQDHWHIVAGVDFGIVNDPSVIVFTAIDDAGIIHLLEEVYLDDDRSPRAIANAIMASAYPNTVVVVPHDGALNSDDPQAKGKLLIEYGVNVWRQTFRNPTDVKLGIDELKQKKAGAYNSKAAGLIEMQRRFEEGTLKVSDQMVNWLKEKRTYFYKAKNGGGVKPIDKNDHCIDASRYAVMSLIGNISSTVYEAQHKSTVNIKSLRPNVRF